VFLCVLEPLCQILKLILYYTKNSSNIKLFKKYDITPEQLPKILDTDPVATAIGAKPEQVIKIIRKSHTAKEAVAYRFVIKSNE